MLSSKFFIVKQHLFRVRSFGVIRIRISDPRSLGSWCIKGTDESTLVTDSSVPLMHRDPSDLGSLILIQIIPKERTLRERLTVVTLAMRKYAQLKQQKQKESNRKLANKVRSPARGKQAKYHNA